jgi:DivIVA domain-containing protein
MEWFIAVVAVAALGVAAIAAAGGMGQMSKEPVYDTYRQDLPDRALTAGDLERLRFGVTLRGYAMGQVDEVLERLGREIADRDARLAEQAAQLARRSGRSDDDPPTIEQPAVAGEAFPVAPREGDTTDHALVVASLESDEPVR